MKALYNNRAIATTTTISSSSAAYGYEANANLKDTRLAKKWRATGKDLEVLVFSDTINAIPATYCVIQSHNLTSDATVTLQGNDSNEWAFPAFSITVPGIRVVSYLQDGSDAYILDGNNDPIWGYDYSSKRSKDNDVRIVTFAKQGFVYWRLVIADAGNPDGYVQIGNVYLGESLTLPAMDPAAQVPYKSSSIASKNATGQLYGDKRIRIHGGTVNFPDIDDALKQEMEYMFDVVDITTPFILLIWENTLEYFPPLYCNLTKDLEYARVKDVQGVYWTVNLSFEECR